MRRAIVALMILALLLCSWNALAKLRPMKLSESKASKLGASLRPKKLALVIGIQHFQKRSGWSPLRYPAKDAKRVAKMLKDAAFDHVLLRTEAAETTTPALLNALKRLGKMSKSAGDTVVVYISSHGTVAIPSKRTSPERYIITSSTSTRVHSTALAVRSMMNVLKRYLSRRILLMLAVCYNGREQSKSQKQRGMKGVSFRQLKPLRSLAAIQTLSAASQGQAAFEHTKLQGDVYTHFYLKCFYQAWKKRAITAIDAHICAVKPTKQFVKEHLGALQVPTLAAERNANRDIFLLRRRPKKRGYLRTSWLRGKSLVFRIFRRGAKSQVRALRVQVKANEYLSLPPGQYRVAVHSDSGDLLHIQNVSIQGGHTAQLEEPFVLGIQGGALFSQKMGGPSAFGAALTFQRSFFRMHIGAWGHRTPVKNANALTYTELRAELGWPLRLGPWFDLFLGGYLGAGLLLQEASDTIRPGFIGSFGGTAQISWWFAPQWGLRIRGSVGSSIANIAGPKALLDISADLGLQWRL